MSIATLQKEAKAGDVNKMCQLASAYYAGEGISKDAKKAFTWYKKAAQKGSGWAHYMLGAMCQEGVGTSKDLQSAVKWYQKGSDSDHQKSTFNLAIMYDVGVGVSRDLNKAAELYEKAAKLGSSEAAFNRAALALSQEYGDVDYGDALLWFIKADDLGDDRSREKIIEVLENIGALEIINRT